MNKIEKCLYMIEVLSRGKPLSLKKINEHWSSPSLYDVDIIPKYSLAIKNIFPVRLPWT